METTEQQFLGTGWSFPPTFVREHQNSVVMAQGNTDIRQSLWLVLSTRLGERIILPQFGSQIWEMVFQGVDRTLITRVQEMVRDAILNWEPRIDVISIEIQPVATPQGVLEVDISYVVRSTNARSNFVYPFYIDEGTIPPQTP